MHLDLFDKLGVAAVEIQKTKPPKQVLDALRNALHMTFLWLEQEDGYSSKADNFIGKFQWRSWQVLRERNKNCVPSN